ncbi:winged helix-turn-helix domain-containing protein [Janthinobacterium agaricidamnosum]|uniref:Bacterial regulatory helix-turn-helix, lysR family protein n=1 Tax=Janthinobacterium agaricidamnosum NBRC 102515 = DSM 9628 TaxID=1349767 RepID=W0V6H0_9BURK|nr:LysR family transcriptional regulator [Janthinobacterium agaricidamnosum]CDG83456.1 bacterial regulatory helix-turn-helix, lysR family protein [Janthinobacterium agaricidamnosum NBRC 102515 = DSM 9628]
MTSKLDIKVRLWRDDEVAMGPGKADLLDAIAHSGSISAAARTMNMSYRRAWLLVDSMNRNFREPLVRSAIGGQQGGGAQVTEAGFVVLAQFRAMQASANAALQSQLAAFAPLLRDAAPALDVT